MIIAILSASAGSTIGSLFASFLLQKIHSGHKDLSPDRVEKVRYALSLFLIDLLTFYVFAHLIFMLEIRSLSGAWELALWIWGGFALSTALIISRKGGSAWQVLVKNLLLRLITYFIGASILIFILS